MTRPIYIASKTRHAPKWRALRCQVRQHFRIVSSWLDWPAHRAGDALLWQLCLTEVAAADALILYSQPGEIHKGALVEAGMALGLGRPVLQVGQCASVLPGDDSDASFTQHPQWHRLPTVDQALLWLLEERHRR